MSAAEPACPTVSTTDRHILRELAKAVRDIAALPEQEEKAARWKRLNRLERVTPPVLALTSNIWNEMPPETRIQTSGEFAQSYERDLRRRVYQHKHFPDDRVVAANIPVPLVLEYTGWGIETQTTAPEQKTGARRYNTVLHSEADLDRLTLPRVTLDRDATERNFTAAREVFGDVLEVERTVYWGNNYGIAPMDMLAVWRGFDRLFIDLLDNPAFVHRAMDIIVDGHLGVVDQHAKQGLLKLNNRRHDLVGTAAVGYTDELPAAGFDPLHVRFKDLWGTCASQIFAEVSPDMHEEFSLQHERRFLDRFGLTCYGCCEPLHKKIGILRKIPNMRRIAVSPWAGVAESAEQMGSKYIFSWRPNPAVLASDKWDAAGARRQIRETLRKTRGCIVEIILKDIETCRNEPRRLFEWVALAREEAAAVG